MELGFWIPIFSGIPDSLSCILDSKAQDSGFNEQTFPGILNFPDSLTRGDRFMSGDLHRLDYQPLFGK